MSGALKQSLDSLIDWGIAKASSISSTALDVLVDLVGSVLDEDVDTSNAEKITEQVLSIDAAVLVRPADPTDAGSFEVAFVRRGDEAIPLATRDARWQISLEKGEVVLRAFGDSASSIHLKTNGEVVINAGGDVKIGDDTAAKALALAEDTDARLTTLQQAHDSHIHVTTATIGSTATPGVISPTAAPVGALATVASSKVKSTS